MATALVPLLLITNPFCTATVEVARNFQWERIVQEPDLPRWDEETDDDGLAKVAPDIDKWLVKKLQQEIPKLQRDLNQRVLQNTMISAKKKRLLAQVKGQEGTTIMAKPFQEKIQVELDNQTKITSKVKKLKEQTVDDLNHMRAELNLLTRKNRQLESNLTAAKKQLTNKSQEINLEIEKLKKSTSHFFNLVETKKAHMNKLIERINTMNGELAPTQMNFEEVQKQHEHLVELNQQLEESVQTANAEYKNIASVKQQTDTIKQLSDEVEQARLDNERTKQDYEYATSAQENATSFKQQQEEEFNRIMPELKSLQYQEKQLDETLERDQFSLSSNLETGGKNNHVESRAVDIVQKTIAEIMGTYGGLIEKFKSHKPKVFRDSSLVEG